MDLFIDLCFILKNSTISAFHLARVGTMRDLTKSFLK